MGERVMQAQKWGEWLGPGVAAAAIGLLIAFLPLATAAALLLVPAVLILIYLFPLFGLGLALLAGPTRPSSTWATPTPSGSSC